MILKTNNTQTTTTLVLIGFLLLTPHLGKGQTVYDNPEQLKQIVLEKDSLFWQAYNRCNIEGMTGFLTEDLEFYHDKNGLTKGLKDFKNALIEGLCANGPQLKRVVKEGTVEVFPMKGIGAIISGEHYFHVGNRADGLAKFTHLWSLKNNEWKMSRVLSYDHQPVPYENKKSSINLSDKLLSEYSGKYRGPETGEVTMSIKGKTLQMKAGPMELDLFAQTESLFYHKQSSLTFEFIADEDGNVLKFIVRENGNIVEEAQRLR